MILQLERLKFHINYHVLGDTVNHLILFLNIFPFSENVFLISFNFEYDKAVSVSENSFSVSGSLFLEDLFCDYWSKKGLEFEKYFSAAIYDPLFSYVIILFPLKNV